MGPCSPQGVSKSNRAVYGSLLGQIMLWDRTLIRHLSNPKSTEEMKSRIKKPEREPGARGSLQSTSLAELTTYSSYAMGDYLQKYRQSSASLLSLSPPTITTLLHFLGLSSLEPLEMSFQVPFVDVPEANGTIQ